MLEKKLKQNFQHPRGSVLCACLHILVLALTPHLARVPAVKAASTSTRHVWIFCRASVPAGRCGAAERCSVKVSSARSPDAIAAASGTAGATNAAGTAVDDCRAAGRSREGASADALVPPAL